MRSMDKMASLALSLSQPYALREGAFMSAFGALNTTLDRFNGLAASSAFGMLWEVQDRSLPFLGGQVAQAVSEAARVSPTWGHLSTALKEYHLCKVRVASMPREHSPTDYDLAPPQPPTSSQPAEEASATEQLKQAPDASTEEGPYQFSGSWRILQPLENTVHCIMNGPLIVRILFMDTRSIVVAVVASGVVFFLFYSS